MKRAAKKDSNHKSIVEGLERIGCVVIDTSQLKNAFDFILCYMGSTYIVEVKNPKYLPKEYNRDRLEKDLSEGEYKCMQKIQSTGVSYHIIATLQEILNIINHVNK